MSKSSDKNLDQLAKILAYNMVGSSFPESEKDAAFKEIFKDFKSQALPSSRNVMIIGAGASNNLCADIPLANTFHKELKKSFLNEYGACGNIVFDNLIKKELDELESIYRLNSNEFETQLAAYAKFDKEFVLKQLKYFYDHRYLVSLFYEIVGHLFKHRFLDIIINFNFDEILDNVVQEEFHSNEYRYIYSDVNCPEEENEATELQTDTWLRDPIYIKPHGTISHASSLKFTKRDYYEMPQSIKRTIKRLLDIRKKSDDFSINLIVVGFAFNSLELNSIIRETLKGNQNLNLYYFDKLDNDDTDGQSAFFKDLANANKDLDGVFTPKNTHFFKIYPDSPDALNVLFSTLWKKIDANFNSPYHPKGISRHLILAKLFNPIASQIIKASNANKGSLNKKHDKIIKYFEYRMLVETGLEICNSVDGILNIRHVRQVRIGKYLVLARNDQAANHNMASFFKHLEKMGLQRHRTNQNETWTFDGGSEKFKKDCLQYILTELKKGVFEECRICLGDNDLKQIIDSFVNKKDGKFLSLAPRPFNTKISCFSGLDEESVLNTDIRWIYNFRKYFYDDNDRDKWDIALAISESGSVFYDEKTLDALQNKKVVMICSHNSNPKQTKEEKYKLLVEQSKSLRGQRVLHDSFLIDDDGKAILKLIPRKNHNQHMLLFCKVDVDNNKLEPKHGIYYERREMSRKVSPLLVRDKHDLESLKSIFLGYYSSAQKEDNIIATHEWIDSFLKSLETNQQITKDTPILREFIENKNKIKKESDIEAFLVRKFIENMRSQGKN